MQFNQKGPSVRMMCKAAHRLCLAEGTQCAPLASCAAASRYYAYTYSYTNAVRGRFMTLSFGDPMLVP